MLTCQVIFISTILVGHKLCNNFCSFRYFSIWSTRVQTEKFVEDSKLKNWNFRIFLPELWTENRVAKFQIWAQYYLGYSTITAGWPDAASRLDHIHHSIGEAGEQVRWVSARRAGSHAEHGSSGHDDRRTPPRSKSSDLSGVPPTASTTASTRRKSWPSSGTRRGWNPWGWTPTTIPTTKKKDSSKTNFID